MSSIQLHGGCIAPGARVSSRFTEPSNQAFSGRHSSRVTVWPLPLHRNGRIQTMVRSVVVGASGSDHVAYTIRCKPHAVEFGQSIAVVSNVHDWDVDHATVLDWKEGNNWEGCVEVPVDTGVFEFKLVTLGDGQVLEWESSDNKVLKVLKKDVKKGVFVDCAWDSDDISIMGPSEGKKKKAAVRKKKTVSVTPSTDDETTTPPPSASAAKVTEPEEAEEETEKKYESDPPPTTTDHEKNDHSHGHMELQEKDGVMTYSFDEGDQGESAADMARRMYG